MCDELQLEMNSTAARAPRPVNHGLAARQGGYSIQGTSKCRSSRTSSTSFAAFPSSTSYFLIETVRRLEITVTHSFKRRKHFLIDTRTGFPVTRSQGIPEHGSRPTRQGNGKAKMPSFRKPKRFHGSRATDHGSRWREKMRS
jgi:hypothetical protein